MEAVHGGFRALAGIAPRKCRFGGSEGVEEEAAFRKMRPAKFCSRNQKMKRRRRRRRMEIKKMAGMQFGIE